MANNFDFLKTERNKQFYQLFNKYKNNLFEVQSLNGFTVMKCNQIQEIYYFCSEMAKEKSKKTVNYGQDYVERSPLKQFNNAFTGIYAETYVHFLLLKYLNIKIEHIRQFDLIRKSWNYPSTWNPPENEYDIIISSENKYETDNFISIEVKSSANRMSLEVFVNYGHLLGGHINKINEKTDINDFYFQVYFQADNDVYIKENDREVIDYSYENFENNKIEMYIVSGMPNKEFYTRGFAGTLHCKGNTYLPDDNMRLANFISNNITEINNLIATGDIESLKKFIKSKEKELKDPLYIQIVNKDADDVLNICKKLKTAYAGKLFEKFYINNTNFFK